MALQITSLLPNLQFYTPSNISHHHVAVPSLTLTQQHRHNISERKMRSYGSLLLPSSAKQKLRNCRVGYSVEGSRGGGIGAMRDCGRNGGQNFSSSIFGDVVLHCDDGEEDEEDAWGIDIQDEDVQMLAKFKSLYNFVQVLEVARRADHPLAGAIILLLDKPGNIQSVYQPYKAITNSYYDLFACLPPLLPHGPIGILGLGAGTAARIIHHFWPQIDLHGWELDPAVVMVARQFFNLSEVEEGGMSLQRERVSAFGAINPQCNENNDDDDDDDATNCEENGSLNPEETKQCGRLVVHIGDALASGATVEGGFAGLIVDIFSDGAVIPALQLPETWQHLKARLRPGGRIMVNCGGSCIEAEGEFAKDGKLTMEETIAAISEIFPNNLSRRNLRGSGSNSVVLTGPLPNTEEWEQTLPEGLKQGAQNWFPVLENNGDNTLMEEGAIGRMEIPRLAPLYLFVRGVVEKQAKNVSPPLPFP